MKILLVLLLIPAAAILYITRPKRVEELKIEDEEDNWFTIEETFCCELCDDIINPGEIIVSLTDSDGSITFCEYCLNPAL